jgi:bifunctional DNA-binding transcriptional regulator/antitoxin component of YhaV-PrlF toxin-antitoxin module
MTKKSWTVTLEEDGSDLILPFPQEMLDEVGWNPGDNLEWHDRGDGTWEIRKKQDEPK